MWSVSAITIQVDSQSRSVNLALVTQFPTRRKTTPKVIFCAFKSDAKGRWHSVNMCCSLQITSCKMEITLNNTEPKRYFCVCTSLRCLKLNSVCHFIGKIMIIWWLGCLHVEHVWICYRYTCLINPLMTYVCNELCLHFKLEFYMK